MEIWNDDEDNNDRLNDEHAVSTGDPCTDVAAIVVAPVVVVAARDTNS